MKALSPKRIEVYAIDESAPVGPPIRSWPGPGSRAMASTARLTAFPPPRRERCRFHAAVSLCGAAVAQPTSAGLLPLNAFWLMTNRIGLQGSVSFTTGEGEDMAAIVAAGTLDVSPLEHRIFPLSMTR